MITTTTFDQAPYNFSKPVELSALTGEDPLLYELVATRAFQRLNSIRFLGAIDYTLVKSPNGKRGRYTRYQHSLGVARLALLYARERDLPLQARRLAYVTALLHDLGHAPLSHSSEPVFEEAFGFGHHKATEEIILGRTFLGPEINETLRRYKIDVEQIVATLAGREDPFEGFFSGPINFDTIEGILRSRTFVRPSPNIPSPEAVTKAAIKRLDQMDQHYVDVFWRFKDQVYRHIINSPSGILADAACQFFMRRHLNKLSADDYFSTEPQFFRKLPGLRKLLRSKSFETDAIQIIKNPIQYNSRRFLIDRNIDFFIRNDKNRYKQTKNVMTLNLEKENLEISSEQSQDLFDDELN